MENTTRPNVSSDGGGMREASRESNPKKGNPIVRLLEYAGARKGAAYAGCALSALNAALAIVPYLCVWFVVRDLVSAYPHWEQADSAFTWAALAAASSVLGIAVYFCALMGTHLAAFRIASSMRKAMTRHIARIPMGHFSTRSSGELRRVIDACAGQTEDVIAHKLPDFVGSFAMPFMFLACAFVFDATMGALCLIPIVVSFVAMWWMMGRGGDGGGRHFMQRYQAALVRMSSTATEYVRGIPVVKVFQQTVHSFRAFYEAIVDYRDMATRYVECCRRPQVVQLVAINSTFAVLVPAGIVLAKSAPDFAAFLVDFLFYVLFSAVTTTMMTKVMYSSEAIMSAEDALSRVDSIMGVAPVVEADASKARHPLDASIEFVDVGFVYPGSSRPALQNISLRVPAGTTAAFVGPSGGGKSTLASLIPRFWDATEGVVMVGGVDVRDVRTEELMGAVAFVFQNERLFKRSLADNVRAGRPEATDDEVLEALRAARCDDIVAKLPDGMHTVVGARGVHLSGGECQRVVLARAILKNAPIVVLDEATAFADPENEALIQQALSTLCEGKTVLTIAHRLSAVADADHTFVIDRGSLVEQGRHKDLIGRDGLYARMWQDYRMSASWKIEGGDGNAV